MAMTMSFVYWPQTPCKSPSDLPLRSASALQQAVSSQWRNNLRIGNSSQEALNLAGVSLNQVTIQKTLVQTVTEGEEIDILFLMYDHLERMIGCI